MYLRAMKFYNTLFQKGLYDPDSMTQTYNDMIEKYTNGAAFFNIFNWMASGAYNTPDHMNAGKIMRTVAAKDQRNIAYGLSVFGGNRVWTIGAKTNYPELCMSIINYFCTPDGVLTYNYGPKDVCWSYNADGDTYLTELGLACQMDTENTVITYGGYTGKYKDGQFQHNNTTWTRDAVNPDSASGETFNREFWKRTIVSKPVTAIEQRWRDKTGFVFQDEYLEKNGHLSVAIASAYSGSNKSADLKTTWEQVKECIKAGSWSAIYAKTDAEFDAIVTKMITDAKGYGYDSCVEWCINEATLRKQAEDLAKSGR
jgi:multiple sugar transport system substrate-binding protein/putative aldouronate transport system substrate-binding protein